MEYCVRKRMYVNVWPGHFTAEIDRTLKINSALIKIFFKMQKKRTFN